MIRTFLTLFVISFTLTVNAQSIPEPAGCGYDHYVHFLDQEYPGFKQVAGEVFQQNKNAISFRDDEVYTIPVVVHIVWQEEEQNLSDEQIQSVIDVLNEDYRRLNTDADMIRSEFEEVVGDPMIEFELVTVERVQTEATFELDILGDGLPDNVKVSAEGGSDAWDPEKYLNIWVCNIEGGSLLGYAYPPAGLDHWPEEANAPEPHLDGVVMHHAVFRRTGTYTTSGLLGLGEITVPVRGRSITHEVGHYLGLRHIWGDGLLSVIGIPDCNADDGVEDTPQQGMSSQFQCDPELNSCEDGAEDLPDMFENYMDYAAEDCMNSFTKQQIAIMRSVLENERSGLIEGTTTDVTAVKDTEEFHVFPNPVEERLFITSDHSDYEVRLIDLQGRPVTGILTGNDRFELNVSNLPGGLYGLLITKGKEQFLQRVVIE